MTVIESLQGRAAATPALPLLGAAMPSTQLGHHREWLWQGRDLELQDPVSHLVLDGDWRTHARRVREQLGGHAGRLGVHGPFWGLSVMAQDPAVQALVSARLRRALEFAAEIGATHMVVHSPFDFFGHPLVAHTAVTGLEEQLALVHDTLRDVLREARECGCMLVMENIRDLNPAPLLALVRSFDSPFVRLSVDVGHAALMQSRGGPSPEQWIREAGSLLAHVHLQDTDGLLDRHWKPGDGNLNWRAVFRALRDVAADPRLILELKPEEISAGHGWLSAQGLAR